MSLESTLVGAEDKKNLASSCSLLLQATLAAISITHLNLFDQAVGIVNSG